MQIRFPLFAILIFFITLPSFVSAEQGYIGEDLGNDIYKRIDEGNYKLKKQLIENRLTGVTKRINDLIGDICITKEGKNIPCFGTGSGIDFTASELDDIVSGALGPIYTHMNKENIAMDTDKINNIRRKIIDHYKEIQSDVTYEQSKIQSIGSIGLFSDGNKDNSSYDLMVDLENIHSVIFAKDIPYNGTNNMGAEGIANLLNNIYPRPFSPLDPILASNRQDPGVSLIPPTTATGLTLSGLVNNCVTCPTLTQIPKNLDKNFLLDVQSQLLVGINTNSSRAFADNAKLPEYWAKIAAGSGSLGGSSGGAGAGTDTFACSKTDIHCIIVSMLDYTQDILAGGKANTIEHILDNNLKIANVFAPSSLTQAKMTNMFFGLSLRDLNLPGMLHMEVNISSLPPPLLNLNAKGNSNGSTSSSSNGGTSGEEGDEFNQIITCAFAESGIDFKRQNSLEEDNKSLMIHNLIYLSTDLLTEKSVTDKFPKQSGCMQARDVEIKKGYGDSFNDDLFELHAFTKAFTKSITKLTDIIAAMSKIKKG